MLLPFPFVLVCITCTLTFMVWFPAEKPPAIR